MHAAICIIIIGTKGELIKKKNLMKRHGTGFRVLAGIFHPKYKGSDGLCAAPFTEICIEAHLYITLISDLKSNPKFFLI